MSVEQIAGLVVASLLAGYAAWNAYSSMDTKAVGLLERCASDALSLAGRLRAAGCPEGVAACQALLNVILEHPKHGSDDAEVKA